MRMQIFTLVENDDLEGARSLLTRKRRAVQFRHKHEKNTPLHYARSPQMVSLLIDHGADVDTRGWMQCTSLHKAAERGDGAVVAALLKAGADARLRRERGDLALHWASSEAIVDLLLDVEPDHLEATDAFGQTPLHWASRFGHTEAVQALVRRGANIDAVMLSGETPLCLASQEGHLSAVKLLVGAGASVNAAGRGLFTPLHAAAFRGQTAVVRYLLTVGADPDLRDVGGRLPYHQAKFNGCDDVAELVVQHTSTDELGRAAPTKDASFGTVSLQLGRLHPDGSQAVCVAEHGRIVRWDLQDVPGIAAWVQTEHPYINDLAVHPKGEVIAVAAHENRVELRRWDDLELIERLELPDQHCTTSLAYCAGGRYLAVGDDYDSVHIIDTATRSIAATAEGGEWTGSMAADPSGTILAVACSFQGGGVVRIARCTEDGRLEPVHELNRSDHKTGPKHFVDTLVHVTFSPDGRHLALFETSAIYHDDKPRGWRGNVVVFDAASGKQRWLTPVPHSLTDDPRTLAAAGHEMGFITRLAFTGRHVVCGATEGTVLFLDAETGKLADRLQLDTSADVIGVLHDVDTGALWALPSEGEPIRIEPNETC